MRTIEHILKNGMVMYYYVGQNQHDNSNILKICSNNDVWFHAKNESSCHVVARLNDDYTEISQDKKQFHHIIKKGALLCKQYTNKLKRLQNVEIIYTNLENVIETSVPGKVILSKQKTIVI